MRTINIMAVLAAAVLAFVIGTLWYSPLLFGKTYARLRGLDADAVSATVPVGEILGEFVRWLIITTILARLMALLQFGDLSGVLVFGG